MERIQSRPDLVVHCKRDEYDVLIDRSTKWGNPIHIDERISRDEAIRLHKKYIMQDKKLLRALGELTGQRLGCHCKPKDCHGDTLSGMANNPFTVKAYG